MIPALLPWLAALPLGSPPVALAPDLRPAPGGGEAHFVDASLELDGELIDWRAEDVDGDGRAELLLTLRSPGGERRLDVHDVRGTRVEPRPRHRVPILDDVLALGLGDVREEPGRELVLLTRGGAWSYSLTLDGYRGNVARLADVPLVFDVPDPRALARWTYTCPGEGGDLVLLPGRDHVSLWGPGGDEGAYAVRAEFPVGDDVDLRHSQRRRTSGEGGRPQGSNTVSFTVEGGKLKHPFLGEDPGDAAALLADRFSYRAPAWVDVDGDGDLDLLLRREDGLAVHLATDQGPAATPTRVEALPEYLQVSYEQDLELELIDLDGDGDLDVLATISDEMDGFENRRVRLLVLLQDRDRLLPEQPHQVLQFEAAALQVRVVDVDGDRSPDLVLRKFELPSLVGTVTGLEFTLTHLVYLGKRGRFDRKPVLRQAQTFDEEGVEALIANAEMSLDLSGDGIADLVELDLDGRIAIHRLRKESGFFSGDSWSLDEGPWKRFETRGSIQSLEVLDLNGDGLGDVVSAGEERLTVLLSSTTGGGR